MNSPTGPAGDGLSPINVEHTWSKATMPTTFNCVGSHLTAANCSTRPPVSPYSLTNTYLHGVGWAMMVR
jgi:hypothetical protein